MKRNFFFFAWREFLRSATFNKNVATKGILIFLVLYFSLVGIFMGFQISEQLTDTENKIAVFNSMVFLYAGIDIFLRVMIQNLPTFGFQPFLILPVKRKRIARYMLNKSLLHFFNVLPLFLLLPFTFKLAVHELETPVLTAWLTSLVLMIFVNHFLAIYIKWRTNESNAFFYGFMALVVGIFAINYFGILNVNEAYGKIFDLVVAQPLAVLIFPVLIALLYLLNQQYLWNRFFIDELSQKKKQGKIYDFSWLNQIGEYGKMLSLEVKMIMRNKRPRQSVIMSVLFLFYGLLLYRDYKPDGPEVILIMGGIFMTGFFSMVYGQFFPAWHSRYYPLLMTQNVKMKQVLQSAFFLMTITNIVYYLLSLGYMYITPKVWYIHLAAVLYNIGVNTWVIFGLGLNSRKAIDLDQRATFNYQGMSATTFLVTFPIIFGPMIVYGLLSLAFGKIAAYIILGSLGLIGIILHPRLIDYFTGQYLKRKHKMIAGYKAT